MSTRIKFVLLTVLSLLMTTLVLNPMSNASAAGDENDTFAWYGATYQKTGNAEAQYGLWGWRGDHLTGHINETAQNGYRLSDIQGYYVPNGGADPIRYDVTFDKTYKAQKYVLSASYGEFTSVNFEYVQQGFSIVFIRSHLVNGNLRFSVIWEQGVGSFIAVATREQVTARDNYLRPLGYTLSHVDVFPWNNNQNLYNATWKKDNGTVGWYWGYKWSDFLTLRDQQAAAGWEPVQVTAYDIDHGAGLNERYDILFRPKVGGQPRVFDYTYSLDAQINKVNAKRSDGFVILSQQRVVNVIRF